MKKLHIAIVLLAVLMAGCANYRELTQDETEAIFAHDVQLSKEELRTKILLYLNENIVSAKSAIQTSEDGLITANFVTTLDEGSVLNPQKYVGQFTALIRYTEKSYKLKLLIKDLQLNGQTLSYGWGVMGEKISAKYKKFDADLFNYIQNKNTDF